jgi:hypothetical protein
LIINMDETSWKQINSGPITLAETGSETVNCFFDGEPKMCLTAIAAIDAAGGKLPLWVLGRGTTTKCERRFRKAQCLEKAISRGELVLSHQENGWTDESVADQYLRWLHERYGERETVLIWDIFPAHRTQKIKSQARELSVKLDFIPAGMTGECQPLDRRIFGSLKARARARFDALYSHDTEPTMNDSVAMLLGAWNSISQDEVLGAWELPEE